MPGNTVIINNSKELEWYVGDSKMDELIKYLDDVGMREQNKCQAKVAENSRQARWQGKRPGQSSKNTNG